MVAIDPVWNTTGWHAYNVTEGAVMNISINTTSMVFEVYRNVAANVSQEVCNNLTNGTIVCAQLASEAVVASWLPTLTIIAIACIVITLLMAAFAGRLGGDSMTVMVISIGVLAYTTGQLKLPAMDGFFTWLNGPGLPYASLLVALWIGMMLLSTGRYALEPIYNGLKGALGNVRDKDEETEKVFKEEQ